MMLESTNHPNITKYNPLFGLQFSLIDQVSNHVKNVLLKKFAYILEVNNNYVYLFQILCHIGNIDMLKLLNKTFNITKENVQANYNLAFLFSCANGHLLIAQWLHETFNLTSRDVRFINNRIFISTCLGGYVDVAEWLYSTFQLNLDIGSIDIRIEMKAMYNTIRDDNHIQMKAWLEKTFGFNDDDIYIIDDKISSKN